MQTDFELGIGMTSAPASFAIEIDQRTETMRFSADNGNHQRQPKRSVACEQLWRSTNFDLDGKLFLVTPREHALARERRTALARPMDVGISANGEQQVEISANNK